jgi:glutaredoxin/glutathione-dependent peroxiredoxin
MIKIGEQLPAVKLKYISESAVEEVNVRDIFQGKKGILFGLPGAFTPTCHGLHLPGFAVASPLFHEKGINLIVCTAVNDIFVLRAWGESTHTLGKIAFLADGNAELATALGLSFDASSAGMGIRSQRYDMLIEDGILKKLVIEPTAGACSATNASSFLAEL